MATSKKVTFEAKEAELIARQQVREIQKSSKKGWFLFHDFETPIKKSTQVGSLVSGGSVYKVD